MKIKRIAQTGIFRAATAALSLLMIPILLQWPWGREDFFVMGIMIFVFGLMLDLVLKKSGKYKAAAGIFIVLIFLWLWAELAVGIFTNWGS